MQETGGASLSDAAHQLTAPPRRFWIFASLGLAGFAADQYSKHWALTNLQDHRPEPFLGRFLQMFLTYNPGAAFSTGTSFTWIFTTIAIVATAAVIKYGVQTRSAAWAFALGILLGGITGNLSDRLTRPPAFFRGHVVDFLMLPHWPVFNIADVLIDTAAVLIVLLTLRGIRLDGTREVRQQACADDRAEDHSDD